MPLITICIDVHDMDRPGFMTTMRESRPPVRFSDPVYLVLPRRNVILRPFDWQPGKYARPMRLPALAVKISGVRGAGFGVFLREKVRAGQTITLYRRKIISEATARRLKKQVLIMMEFNVTSFLYYRFLEQLNLLDDFVGKWTHSS